MHYGPYDCSRNGLPTSEAVQPGATFGQRERMSPLDIQEIRLFYNCQASGVTFAPTTPAPPINDRKLLSSHRVTQLILSWIGQVRFCG